MATVTALTLLAFVAVLLAALGTWIGLDARRTHAAGDDAQLRQFLHAGALAASDASVGTTDVPLPPSLGAQVARLTIIVAEPSPTARTARIEAVLAMHQARQVVQYVRAGDRWTVSGATLE
jgi:hypothetical protein